MEQVVNQITLCGTLAEPPVLSHENHGTRFYTFPLEVERLSGTTDTLRVVAPEAVMEACDPFGGKGLMPVDLSHMLIRQTKPFIERKLQELLFRIALP